MSLLGSAAMGLGLSDVAGDIIVKYSKSQYQEKIDRLDRCVQKLASHASNLKGYKEELKTIWDDEQAQKYHKILDKEIKSVENAQEQVNKQIQMWKNAIKEMEDTVTEQQDKMNIVKSALDALDIKD